MSQIDIPLSHLTIHDTSWRPLMGVTMMRKILSLVQMRSVRRLKKVMRLNWVRSLNITSSDVTARLGLEAVALAWLSRAQA